MIDTTAAENGILQTRLEQTQQKLALAEDVLKRQAGAILDIDLKIYSSMKQLLTANDVYKLSAGHEPMRVNVLEIMNTLRRFASNRFKAAGIDAYISPATGDRPIHREVTAEDRKPRLDRGAGDGTGYQLRR